MRKDLDPVVRSKKSHRERFIDGYLYEIEPGDVSATPRGAATARCGSGRIGFRSLGTARTGRRTSRSWACLRSPSSSPVATPTTSSESSTESSMRSAGTPSSSWATKRSSRRPTFPVGAEEAGQMAQAGSLAGRAHASALGRHGPERARPARGRAHPALAQRRRVALARARARATRRRARALGARDRRRHGGARPTCGGAPLVGRDAHREGARAPTGSRLARSGARRSVRRLRRRGTSASSPRS